MKHPKIEEAWKKREQLRIEGYNLCDQMNRLNDEVNRLASESRKLWAESRKVYGEAVAAAYGADANINWETGEIEVL